MTLFVTPVMYSVLNSRHDRKREKAEARKQAGFADNSGDTLQLAAGGK
jgi:hypothetical protein